MSDGIELDATVTAPTDPATGRTAGGRFPVILTLTPYAKDEPIFQGVNVTPAGDYVPHGYIDVVADVRGTGSSGGSFELLGPREVQDSVEMIRWAAHLPHSSGAVGMVGESYLAIDQWFAAAAVGRRSPLKAIFPIDAGSDLYRDMTVPGGMFNSLFDTPYSGLEIGMDTAGPIAAGGPLPVTAQNLGMHVEGNFDVDMQTLADAFDGGDRAYDQGFWAQRDMAGAIARIPPNGVAVLAYNSWFDIWQRGDSLVYSILQNAAARRQPFAPMTPHQRVSPRYQVVLGPYVHAESGSLIPALLGELSLEWFDTWLKHERTGIAGTRTPLHAYELHGGRWTDTTTWPPPSVRPLTLYFDHGPSASGAASLNDGALAPTHPSDRSSDQIWWNGELNSPCTRQLYQQSNAILLVTPTVDNPCFYDDRSFELGALTYTTSPFTRAIDVAGPGDVTVYATANTPNTEWVATLSDVAPDGSARPLTTAGLIGSLRALDPSRSWTRGGRLLMPWHPFTRASETPVIPGALTRYDIELPGILTRVQPGHRLRLTLQTSDAPYLAPTLPDQDQLLGGRYAVSRGGTFASELTLATLAPRNLRRGSPSWGPCRLDC